MAITIRPPELHELAELTELVMRSKQSNGYDDAFMQACRDELTITPETLQQGEYWVAVNPALCGCACLQHKRNAQMGEVHAFFVDPACQRQGVGRLLWHTLLQRATQLRLASLTLDADPAAVPFYHELGFEIIGEAASGSIAGRMLPHMRLVL